MTRIIMVGAKGRMGQAIIKLAKEAPDFKVVGEISSGDNILDSIAKAEVIIDFSHHSVSGPLAQIAANHRKAIVIGTTGHSPEELSILQSVAIKIPIVFAPNFSVGVNVLFYLTRKAAEILGSSYDQEVIEMHHRLKIDAPSGTGKRLAEILCEVKGHTYSELVREGRVGEVGERTTDEIGMHSLRGGDVVGDHTTVFAGTGERLELTHKASSRDTFAAGALRAAAWAQEKKNGLYSMQDVLGLH